MPKLMAAKIKGSTISNKPQTSKFSSLMQQYRSFWSPDTF